MMTGYFPIRTKGYIFLFVNRKTWFGPLLWRLRCVELSMAEAAIMSYNVSRGKRSKILVSPGIHPQYRQVLRSYLPSGELEVTGDEDLNTDLADLISMLDEETACLIVQNPDFFGEVRDLADG